MKRKEQRPLTEAMFYTLMAVQKREICGTEIAEYVLDITGGRVHLGPGTLYTILGKFLEDKLIEEIDAFGRKRTYAVTNEGKAAYAAELSRLRRCILDAEKEEET